MATNILSGLLSSANNMASAGMQAGARQQQKPEKSPDQSLAEKWLPELVKSHDTEAIEQNRKVLESYGYNVDNLKQMAQTKTAPERQQEQFQGNLQNWLGKLIGGGQQQAPTQPSTVQPTARERNMQMSLPEEHPAVVQPAAPQLPTTQYQPPDVSISIGADGRQTTNIALKAATKTEIENTIDGLKRLEQNGTISHAKRLALQKAALDKNLGDLDVKWTNNGNGTETGYFFTKAGDEIVDKRKTIKTSKTENDVEAWQLPDGTIKYIQKSPTAQITAGSFRVGTGQSGASMFGPKAGAAANSGLTGEEFINTLDLSIAKQVRALAEGRMQFPSGFALKSDYWQNMLAAVAQYDPGFDAINYNARYQTRKSFTSGTDSANITALNTAIAHLNSLKTAYDNLENGSFPSWNFAANWLGEQFGSKKLQRAVGNIKTFGEGVAGELAKVFRQTGMSESEINAWREQTKSTSATPAQVSALVQSAIELMVGRLQALGSKYTQGMGVASNGVDLLSPKAQETLVALKPDMASEVGSLHVNPPGSAPDGSTPPASTAQITVTAPDGSTFTFPNQQAADQFKQAAGIK